MFVDEMTWRQNGVSPSRLFCRLDTVSVLARMWFAGHVTILLFNNQKKQTSQ
jgi:hypothetical protein